MLTEEKPRAHVIEREFPKITQQGLDDLRQRIGIKIGATLEPWCHEATRDNIRHYAHGIGDDNPLWCDPEYAAKTRFGGIVALPSFLFSTNRIISGYVGGLPGVHAMWSGADWNWHQPIRRNDVISTESLSQGSRRARDPLCRTCGPADRTTSTSSIRMATRSPTPTAGAFAPSATTRARRARSTRKCVRAPRASTRRRSCRKSTISTRTRKSAASARRHWEDVKEGDELPTMAKGPMTVTGFIAYAQGWGGLYIRANKLAWKLIQAHPGAGIKNRYGIPDVPERVHWEEEFALEVGAPGAYDYGPERCSWLTHHLTNWMGDDGFLRRAECKVRRHNPQGDLLFIKGKVKRKFVDDGRHLVEIEQEGRNQDRELSVVGSGIVELPSRA